MNTKTETNLIILARKQGLKVIQFTCNHQRLYWLRTIKNKMLLFNGDSLDIEELREFLLNKEEVKS